MPAIAPRILVHALLNAYQESGVAAVLLSSVSKHPRKLAVQTSDQAFEAWIFVWTLTPGGRPSLPNEYRIQMTTVAPPLVMNPHGPTLLLGYEPNLKVFAGFDLERHRTFTPGSSSVQVDIRTLHAALQDGLAFGRKDNDEIAVGIRPDQLLKYSANSTELHRLGAQARTFDLLVRASTLHEIPTEELAVVTEERRRIVSTVSRIARDANFRRAVLDAYQSRCAVTRWQLRVIEAAHILPVGVPGSIDDVRNGFALSPTIHRAYDNALIYLDENYTVRINQKKEKELVDLRLAGGINELKTYLGKKIHLPADRRQWPSKSHIRKANEYRQI